VGDGQERNAADGCGADRDVVLGALDTTPGPWRDVDGLEKARRRSPEPSSVLGHGQSARHLVERDAVHERRVVVGRAVR
jgi:hypothetical protein